MFNVYVFLMIYFLDLALMDCSLFKNIVTLTLPNYFDLKCALSDISMETPV
jgi:hypothetical protein